MKGKRKPEERLLLGEARSGAGLGEDLVALAVDARAACVEARVRLGAHDDEPELIVATVLGALATAAAHGDLRAFTVGAVGRRSVLDWSRLYLLRTDPVDADRLGPPAHLGPGGFRDRAALLRAVIEECSPMSRANAQERARVMLSWLYVWGVASGLPPARATVPRMWPALESCLRKRLAVIPMMAAAVVDPELVLLDALRAYGLGTGAAKDALRSAR